MVKILRNTNYKNNTMQKLIKTILFLLIVSSPYLVFAAGLVPDCNAETGCGFNDLITLVKNIIKWIIVIAPMLAALTFSYAGFLYITSGGNESKNKEAHEIFIATAWGLIIILAAWLIVNAILSGLNVTGDFNLLK